MEPCRREGLRNPRSEGSVKVLSAQTLLQRSSASAQLSSPTTTTRTKGWRSGDSSPWMSHHTGGSRQDTHGTPVPERGGRG